MKKFFLIVCMGYITINAQLTIENRSAYPAFIDTVTLLNFDGIKQVPQIKEINRSLEPGNKLDTKTIAHNTQALVSQVTFIHNNIMYQFDIPNTQETNITITQNNLVTTEGPAQLIKKESIIPRKKHTDWGVRYL